MCDLYGCSRLTVRKALEELTREGYIYKIQGKGTFVKERTPQKQNFSVITSCSTLIRSQNMTPTKKILFEGIVPATADIAQRLGLHEGDSVLEYRRVYYANGTPVIYGRSYFNASVLPGIESFNLQNQSIITLLKEKYDLEIHCSNRELRAVVSDETTSRLLGTPNRFPLLQVTDLKTGVWQDTKIPVEYYTFLYVTERIRYSPDLKQHRTIALCGAALKEARQYFQEKTEKRKKDAKKKTITVSTTDPDCGLFVKGEHKKQLAYEAHTACDVHGVVLAVEVTPGNVHDSVAFYDEYDHVVEQFPDVHAFVADSAYKTPHICKKVFSDDRVLSISLQAPYDDEGRTRVVELCV